MEFLSSLFGGLRRSDDPMEKAFGDFIHGVSSSYEANKEQIKKDSDKSPKTVIHCGESIAKMVAHFAKTNPHIKSFVKNTMLHCIVYGNKTAKEGEGTGDDFMKGWNNVMLVECPTLQITTEDMEATLAFYVREEETLVAADKALMEANAALDVTLYTAGLNDSEFNSFSSF
jgi:hypothetical protein